MGKGSAVQVPEIEMTPEERELLSLIVEDYKTRSAMASETNEMIGKFFQKDYMGGALSETELSRLNRDVEAYQDIRTQPLLEQYAEYERKTGQTLSRRGLFDSSVATKAFSDIEKTKSKDLSAIGKEVALYRSGAETDLRTRKLNEAVTKFSSSLALRDPNAAMSLMSGMAANRSQEQNRALQVALYNAQNQGGFMSSFLPLLMGGLAAGLTGGLGAGAAAAIGAGGLGLQAGSALAG